MVYGAPITHTRMWEADDGTRELAGDVVSGAGPTGARQKLLSLEISGAWMNEARGAAKAILDGLTGRGGDSQGFGRRLRLVGRHSGHNRQTTITGGMRWQRESEGYGSSHAAAWRQRRRRKPRLAAANADP